MKRFNRFELKYLVKKPQKDRVVDGLARQMRLDTHAKGDGTYRIASLYFDSLDLACFFAKIEGIRYRRKVRLRIYDRFLDDLEGPVHAEIKQRIGRTVQKRRTVAPMAQALAWISGREAPRLDDPQDQAVAEEIVYMSETLGLRPACVTSYVRQAWVGSDSEPGLRVTFDSDVACRAPDKLLGRGVPEYLVLPDDVFIMEVKVNDAVPIWVTRLLAKEECALRRISKYCEGISKLRELAGKAPE